MIRFVFAIPHFFSNASPGRWHGSRSGDRRWRSVALRRTVLALAQTFGNEQCIMQLKRRESEAANQSLRGAIKIVICTSGDQHLVEDAQIPPGLVEHVSVDDPATQLGYACHRILKQYCHQADWFGYLEDDLLLQDSLFFQKLAWFSQVAGSDAILLPNRFEAASQSAVLRAYVDGELRDEATSKWQDRSIHPEIIAEVFGSPVRFVRPSNPHAGCFFLNSEQMNRWIETSHFLDFSSDFIGPLESAATLGIMRTFRIYKPSIAYAGFLEIQHQSDQFIRQLRRKE